MEYNDTNLQDRSQIVFHNRSSTDYGMKLLFPWNPPAPQIDATAPQIPGVSGDYSSGFKTYRAVDITINTVIRIPERYHGNWSQLKGDIENWLYGDEDYLKFRDDPEFLYIAQVYTPPTFTPVNAERIDATITFHFQPYKIAANSREWLKIPTSGIVTNKGTATVKADWHINGNGSFLLKVNDFPYEFDNVDGDLYLIGEEGNAYNMYPKGIQNGLTLLNDHLRLANNEAPQFLCSGDGTNTVTIETISGTLNKIEFLAKWRRLI